jgi:hypothetical protein
MERHRKIQTEEMRMRLIVKRNVQPSGGTPKGREISEKQMINE